MIPSSTNVFKALFKADLLVQWRNRRAVFMVLLIPVFILFCWKNALAKIGPYYILSTCLTIGLISIGLMGYSATVSRDRDKGIFQRLRVAPFNPGLIMTSKLLVQLMMIFVLTILIFLGGYYLDGITISAQGYAITFITALISGAVYLSLGQLITGLITNPESVNGATRMIYFVFVMVGMLGELGTLGDKFRKVSLWSPYGTVKAIISTGMQPGHWDTTSTQALMLCLLYAAVFTIIGVRKFRWAVK
ncbi:ABC transporter permease [Chitinophaga sp.]|uniref:ABC transporter permease n=1 Tax=Chitinophaga sp. TaxID=1869181 RepID=UPI0031CF1402